MSTDWNRYATAEDTRARARRPQDNAVIAMNVGLVRAIPDQRVQHSPVFGDPTLPNNRDHTDILGSKEQDPEVRIGFLRISRMGQRLDANE